MQIGNPPPRLPPPPLPRQKELGWRASTILDTGSVPGRERLGRKGEMCFYPYGGIAIVGNIIEGCYLSNEY